MNMVDMVNLLIKIVYYFPNHAIIDIHCIDFILKTPYHKNAWPKHMAMIQKRYDFWTNNNFNK